MPRLDIRIDQSCKEKLHEVAEQMGTTISDAVRQLVHEAYDRLMQERRKRAAERIAAMALDDPGDPAELCRELEGAHATGAR
jgi:hypothetical protein